MKLLVHFCPANTGTIAPIIPMVGAYRGMLCEGGNMGLHIDLLGSQTIDGHRFPDGRGMLIDPRSVILNQETGEVLYTPRAHINDLPKGWQDWLAANPEWPAEPYRVYAKENTHHG